MNCSRNSETKKEQPYPAIPFVDWAFQQGRQSGLEKDLTQRGIMVFGLGFAATPTDALNVKNWLNGFEQGLQEASRAAVPSSSLWPAYTQRHKSLRVHFMCQSVILV
jgi:hypothetical protein